MNISRLASRKFVKPLSAKKSGLEEFKPKPYFYKPAKN